VDVRCHYHTIETDPVAVDLTQRFSAANSLARLFSKTCEPLPEFFNPGSNILDEISLIGKK